MGCGSCSGSCSPAGCGNKGHCSSGGCNRMNTYDWLSTLDLPEFMRSDLVEISFKNGIRKEFFHLPSHVDAITGDFVAVEGNGGGYDVGRISLSGELVKVQLKKKKIKNNSVFQNVLRKANERDLEKLDEARNSEKNIMIQSRIIAAQLGLDMKIGEVEVQGDMRKATFYYTAEGRVDFRELIRIYARDFKVKVEMKQIGARQESAIIGGLGSCGRELCCSTWLTDFKSVSTGAARYQNLAINQAKLSGQCGRLKCCLNYELNTYLDALKAFPKNVDKLETLKGTAHLFKTDIFKRLMYFAYRKDFGAIEVHPLTVEQVKEIHALNKKGIKPDEINSDQVERGNRGRGSKNIDEFVDGAGSLELSQLEQRNKKKKKRPQTTDQNPNAGHRNPSNQAGVKNQDQRNTNPNQQNSNQNNQNNQNRNKHKKRKPQHKHPLPKGNQPQQPKDE